MVLTYMDSMAIIFFLAAPKWTLGACVVALEELAIALLGLRLGDAIAWGFWVEV
jgi:hypothetical protein